MNLGGHQSIRTCIRGPSQIIIRYTILAARQVAKVLAYAAPFPNEPPPRICLEERQSALVPCLIMVEREQYKGGSIRSA